MSRGRKALHHHIPSPGGGGQGLIKKPYPSLAGTRCSPYLLPSGLTQFAATVTVPRILSSYPPKPKLKWEHRQLNSRETIQTHASVVASLTLYEFRLVCTPHALQDAVVEGLRQLGRHGRVEVRLVALQYALQRELAHTQHLVVHVHDVFAPGFAVLVLKEAQVQDLVYAERKQGGEFTQSRSKDQLTDLTISQVTLELFTRLSLRLDTGSTVETPFL